MRIADPYTKAAETLSETPEVALACHVNPDADALGSMLGLSNHLRAMGKRTVCSFPNDPFEAPRWAAMLPGTEALVAPGAFPSEPQVMVSNQAVSSCCSPDASVHTRLTATENLAPCVPLDVGTGSGSYPIRPIRSILL